MKHYGDRVADVLSQAELNSLHGVTMDSTKLLTDKLTLARELTALKPEVDHLRSQAASHQSLLADKLYLQRQLSTVQVELETEKRATERALQKEAKTLAEDAKQESRVESLQADLAKERRERQRIDREAQKVSNESENRISTLESRLDAFRNKLKYTKEQLKDAQTSLQTLQASNHSKFSRPSTSAKSNMLLAANPHKRGAAQIDADTTIGTPGDLPATKKSRHASTSFGEKSTFSITPFFNRAVCVASDVPPPDNASGNEEQYLKGSDQPPEYTSQEAISDLMVLSNGTKNPMQARKPGVLENAKTSKINPRVAPARKAKAAPILEQVAEENIEYGCSTTSVSDPIATRDISNEASQGVLEIRKRKRKLLGGGLGKTLFDEDEGDALKVSRGLFDGVREFATLGKAGLGAPEFGPPKAIGSQWKTFGSISPLKRDKKGAQ